MFLYFILNCKQCLTKHLSRNSLKKTKIKCSCFKDWTGLKCRVFEDMVVFSLSFNSSVNVMTVIVTCCFSDCLTNTSSRDCKKKHLENIFSLSAACTELGRALSHALHPINIFASFLCCISFVLLYFYIIWINCRYSIYSLWLNV